MARSVVEVIADAKRLAVDTAYSLGSRLGFPERSRKSKYIAVWDWNSRLPEPPVTMLLGIWVNSPNS